MAGISALASTSSRDGASTVTSAASDALGQDAFLQLFITELRYQDAMDPVKDKDFIAQLATFSNLEQLTQLNKGFASFAQTNEKAQIMNLLGMKVEGSYTNLQGVTSAQKGIVVGVNFKSDGSTAMVETANGTIEMLVDNIYSVELPTVAQESA